MAIEQTTLIEAIKQAVAVAGKLPDNAVIVPEGYKLESLDRFGSAPRFFNGTFSTTILSEFTDYVSKHCQENTAVYIDNVEVMAGAIIDQGCHEMPQWGFHRAKINLVKEPAYQALLSKNNMFLSQQDFIDFCEDWGDNITFVFEDDIKIPFDTVIKRLRRVKVGFVQTKEQEVQNHSSNKSLLESVDIKAGNEDLPMGFVFTTVPYDGISCINFQCQLRATSDNDKGIKFKYRVGQLDAINDRISIEFRKTITDALELSGADLTSIHIGNMSFMS